MNEVYKTKPWGFEKWLVGDRIVMKVLGIDAGAQFSYQYHVKKEEILYIESGTGKFVLGEVTHRYKPGDWFHVKPFTNHRLTAKTDTRVLEASTTELDDVVRLEDDYNRN